MRTAVLLALIAVACVSAFPFSANSGVVELTPKTLNNFLNTHKPVFIMFYAPWCGHCRTAHPEWEKFAKGVKDVVRVGAVNADEHRDIGQQFGIQGFPTIKYWKMGPKKGKSPLDYQGARSHGAFHNAALAEIVPAVTTASSMADVQKALAKPSSKKAVILASSKSKSPPIFSVLSQSPKLKDKIAFVLVPEKSKALLGELGIEKVPTVMVVGEGAEGGALEKTLYDGKVEYTGIAKWLLGVLGEDATDDETGTGTPSASIPKDGKKAKDEGGSKATPSKSTEPPKPAAPVRPTELTADNFRTFCAFGSTKVDGKQPLCVLVLGDNGDEVARLHEKYGRDATLFFFTTAAKAGAVAEELHSQLRPMAPLEAGNIIIIRASKAATKYVVWKEADGRTFDSFMDLVVQGATTFEKAPGFPIISSA